MRNTTFAVSMSLAIGALCMALPATARAEGEAVFGGQWWYQDFPEAKYQELRVVPRGGLLESYWLTQQKDKNSFWLNGSNALQHDQRMNAGWANGTRMRVDVGYAEIPHRFSDVSQLIWSQSVAGTYLLPDTLQAQNQRSSTAYPNNMKDALNASPLFPLSFRTDVTDARIRFRPQRGLLLEAVGSQRNRSGTKAYGASMGFNSAYELPEPIQETITDADLRANWEKNDISVQASAGVSLFDNQVDKLQWDNPKRITDVSGGDGDSIGQIALYPDNREVHGNAALSWRLPRQNLLSVTASFAQVTQDQAWLATTTNSRLRPDTLQMPGTSTDAKSNVTNIDARLTSQLTTDVSGTARYHSDDYDNQTPEVVFPGFSPYGASWTAGPFENHAYGNKRWNAAYDADWRVTGRATVGGTIEYRERERTHREVEKDAETVYGLKARVNPTPGVSLNARWKHGDRKLDEFLQEDYYSPTNDTLLIEQARLRRFDVADRVQDDVNAGFAWMVNEWFDVSGDYRYLANDYDAGFGLTKDDQQTLMTLGSIHPNDRWDLNGGYGYSVLKTNQISNETGTAPPPTDDRPNDWSVDIKDENVYYFAEAVFEAMPKKLNLSAKYEFTRDHGQIDLTAGSAITTFGGDLPHTFYRRHEATVEAGWKFLANTEVTGRYGYEEFDLVDFAQKDVPVLGFTGTNLAAIYMGDFYHDYKAHRLALLVKHSF